MRRFFWRINHHLSFDLDRLTYCIFARTYIFLTFWHNMSEFSFYCWLNRPNIYSDLMQLGLIINLADTQCFNCRHQNTFYWTSRSRNLTKANRQWVMFYNLSSKHETLPHTDHGTNISLGSRKSFKRLFERKLMLSKIVCINWRYFLREICALKFPQRGRFGNEGHILQVDDALMHGKRKANRGQLMLYEIY